MRSLKATVVLLAIAGVSSITSASLFFDDFESYAAGSSLHGQGGWKGWDNNPSWTAFASDAQANSGSISVAIDGSADLVHEFDFAGGKLKLSAMQYIPVGGYGQSYFLLLNQYNDGGPYDWSVQLNCDMDTGQIVSDFGGGSSLPIKFGEWVQLKFIIDLAANNVDEYYDGILLSSHVWDDTLNGTLECIDLFGNGASSIYYDDITVDPPPIYNITQDRLYESIQEAIDSAIDGDEIEAAAGTYNEAINFLGKAVHLYSRLGPEVTTIDASGLGSSVVTCANSEDAYSILEGFTITGGDAYMGGGMYNYYSSPTVTNCIFISNAAYLHGGGIHNEHSDPSVINCIFSGNTANAHGGGMMNNYGSVSYTVNCVFIGNTANGWGGGCCNAWCFPYFINCTFYGNTGVSDGGAIYSYGNSTTIQNCIFWNDSSNEIVYSSCSMSVNYSDVQGGWEGAGENNINSDPLFKDPAGRDLRLASGSPCIDTGNNGAPNLPSTDLEGNTRAADGDHDGEAIVDMGAYEFQSVPIHNINKDIWYETIQAAIDDADDGDEIEVGAGTYYEAINFNDTAVRLYSMGGPEVTTIDGTGNYHVVQCVSGEGPDSILEGFTITGGNANGLYPDDHGGGMYNYQSSPTVTECIFTGNSTAYGGGGMGNEDHSNPIVTNCTFIGNSADFGGGMHNVLYSSPTVTNCRFISNAAYLHGGGIYNEAYSSPTVTNCIFNENWADYGGGMHNMLFSSPTVTNCTFSGNSAILGAGMYNIVGSSPTVTNCIFWNDTPNEISDMDFSAIVSYSDVQGGWEGEGNIDAYPLFVDAEIWNLRLGDLSPCVDAGNNDAVPVGITTDLNSNPRFADDAGIPDTGYGIALIVDMGAYERQIDSVGPIYNVTQGRYYLQIQAAIDDADAGDEIEAAAGTYYEAINFNGLAVRLYSGGGPEVTTINGTGYNHVVQCVRGEGPDSILEGFTITGGNANGPEYKGAGMYNYQSSPTVTKCIFTGNSAGYGGGGMGNEDNSNPIVTNCTFSGNSANSAGSGGGGMGNEDNSNPIVTNCTFSGNSASYGGGGMGNANNSNPIVTNCTFNGNTADSGAGMGNEDNSNPTVTNCRFSGNSAVFNGGGMVNVMDSCPAVTNCTFSGNSAEYYGGGMYNEGVSSPTVTNCIFWNDTPNEITDMDFFSIVSYSNIQGGWEGEGHNNIDANPFFIDAVGGDLRLDFGSPCIDAGDNSALPSDVLKDLAGKLRFVDDPYTDDIDDVSTLGRPVVDMGAYEFQGCGTISQNHMANPGFETGNTTGWITNWGFGLEATTELAYEGSYSGLTKDRTESWHGAWQSLLGLMDDGKTYRISGWVRLKDATSDSVRLTVAQTDSAGAQYYWIDNATAYGDQWVYLDGTFTLDVAGELTGLYIYFEGPEPEINFYLDNASVTEVTGDLDHNGGVDLIDFSMFALYYGIDCSLEDCDGANFYDCDNAINGRDLAIICSNWLVGVEGN